MQLFCGWIFTRYIHIIIFIPDPFGNNLLDRFVFDSIVWSFGECSSFPGSVIFHLALSFHYWFIDWFFYIYIVYFSYCFVYNFVCLFFLYASITFFTLLLVADAALPFKDQCVKWHNEYRSRHQVNYYKPVFKNLSCKQSETARNRNFKLSLPKLDSRFLLNHL